MLTFFRGPRSTLRAPVADSERVPQKPCVGVSLPHSTEEALQLRGITSASHAISKGRPPLEGGPPDSAGRLDHSRPAQQGLSFQHTPLQLHRRVLRRREGRASSELAQQPYNRVRPLTQAPCQAPAWGWVSDARLSRIGLSTPHPAHALRLSFPTGP